jgi:hypothetical protein
MLCTDETLHIWGGMIRWIQPRVPPQVMSQRPYPNIERIYHCTCYFNSITLLQMVRRLMQRCVQPVHAPHTPITIDLATHAPDPFTAWKGPQDKRVLDSLLHLICFYDRQLCADIQFQGTGGARVTQCT